MSCVVKNELWLQKQHKKFGEFLHKQLKVMLDKFSAYNAFFGQKQQPIRFQLFGLSTCLKWSKFLMQFFKPGVSIFIKFAPFCNILAKKCKRCTEKPQSSISKHPFSEVPSFSKISQPSGQNQQIGKQCCLRPLFFKPHGYIFSYCFKLLRVLSLSRMLAEFSLTCTFHQLWGKIFSLWC